MIDPSFNWGSVAAIATTLVTAAAFAWMTRAQTMVLSSRMDETGRRITALEDDAKNMSRVLVQLADNNGRFSLLEERQMAQGKRLDEMRAAVTRVESLRYDDMQDRFNRAIATMEK